MFTAMNRLTAFRRPSRCALLLLLSLTTASAADPPKSAALPSSPTNPIALPLEFRRGHLMVPARLDGSEVQSFVLDSGYSITMLGAGQADALQLRRMGHVTIVGIAGEELADTFE